MSFLSQNCSMSEPVIHHKLHPGRSTYIVLRKECPHPPPYGVSTRSKLLPVSLFTKKYSQVKRCLESAVGLSQAEAEATMRLIRLQVYYHRVYPKAKDVACDFDNSPDWWYSPYTERIVYKKPSWGTSKATFWRAVRRLKDLGLITVVNRYVLRPKAQISNLYLLHKLLLLIVRYLAEHGVGFSQKWLRPYLTMCGSQFWPWMLGEQRQVSGAAP